MAADLKPILEAANRAILEGDHEGFLSFCTEDTVWNFVGDRVLHGKPSVREWMTAAYKEPPRFEVHRLIADGNALAAIGEIMLADDTGNLRSHAYCDVWRFRDGKLAELQAFVAPATTKID